LSSLPAIKIKLSPSLREPVQTWVNRFNENGIGLRSAEQIDDVLVVSPFDVSEIIKLSNESESSQLDAMRFKKIALDSINTAIASCRSEFSKKNLLNALEMAVAAKIGEFIKIDLSVERSPTKTGDRFRQV
jgi:hypothetical protein